MKMIDRFDLYMRHKRLNDNQVSTQLGLSNGVIGKSRKPGRDISRRVLELIEKCYPDLNMDWIKTGDGEMLKPVIIKPNEVHKDGFFIPDDTMNTIKSQQETIKLLTEMINRLTGGQDAPKKELAG